jgi:hypothetical protein
MTGERRQLLFPVVLPHLGMLPWNAVSALRSNAFNCSLNGPRWHLGLERSIAVGTALSTHGVGPPPAQIRAGAISALGSCLGFWRQSGPRDRDAGYGLSEASARRLDSSAPNSSGLVGFVAAATSASAERAACETSRAAQRWWVLHNTQNSRAARSATIAPDHARRDGVAAGAPRGAPSASLSFGVWRCDGAA